MITFLKIARNGGQNLLNLKAPNPPAPLAKGEKGKNERQKTLIKEKMKIFKNIIGKLKDGPKGKDIIDEKKYLEANEKYLKILIKIREISFYVYTISFIVFFITYFLNVMHSVELLSFSVFLSFMSINFAIYFDIKTLTKIKGEKK